MAKYEGSIKFDTKLDSSGFMKGAKGLASAATGALKGIGVGAGVAAAAIGKIGYDAMKAYGDYEQLVGGVETLFGAGGKSIEEYAASIGKSATDAASEYATLMTAQAAVLANADNAYKTAGMSANEYMETATSFAASLLQSVGGDSVAAANKADMAITDMSDNANKMGTDIARIQDAYQGFAKQNYTMLDNLKLGYGGTKTEMERLLADASKISGIQYDVSSYGDIVDAIHVIQTEMGVTGTTALEASTTLQGSFKMMSASWENLMTGLTDPEQDLDALIQNLFESITTFGDNLIPRLETILGGVANMVTQLAPKIIEAIPGITAQLLPAMTEGISQLLLAASDALAQIVPTVLSLSEQLIPVAIDVLTQIANTIIENLPLLLDVALQLILELANGLTAALPQMIPQIVDIVLTMVDTLIDNIDVLIDVAIDLIMALADGLIEALPILIERGPEIITKLVEALMRAADKLIVAAGELIGKLAMGILGALPSLMKAVQKAPELIMRALSAIVNSVAKIGENIVKGIWKGITGMKDWLISKLKKWCGETVDKIKEFFGIHSPSRVMRDEVGKYLSLGVAAGIEQNSDEVVKAFDGMLEKLENQRKFDIISEDEYYTQLEKLRDKYLKAGSKEWLSYTEKIYSYQKSAVESQKNDIKKLYDDVSSYADKKLSEVEKKQESYAKKVSSFGELFKTGTIKTDDETITFFHGLGDINGQINEMTRYTQGLERLRQRLKSSGISDEAASSYFAEISEMSAEDAQKAFALLERTGDDEFNAYIKAYEKKLQLAKSYSASVYEDEMRSAVDESTQYMKDELTKAGFEVPEGFFTSGSISAEKFGEGFAEQLDEELSAIRKRIDDFNAELKISASAADTKTVTNNINNSSHTSNYTISPAKGESAHAQLEAARNFETLNNMRSGYYADSLKRRKR